jgi:hypothetical protein
MARLARNQREEITEVWFGQRPTFYSFLFLLFFFFENLPFLLAVWHKRVCGNEDRLRHIHLGRIKAHYLDTLGVSLNSGPEKNYQT